MTTNWKKALANMRKRYRQRFTGESLIDASADIDHAYNRLQEPWLAEWNHEAKEPIKRPQVEITIHPVGSGMGWEGYLSVKRGDRLIYGNTITCDDTPMLFTEIARCMKQAVAEDQRYIVGPAKSRLTRERKARP